MHIYCVYSPFRSNFSTVKCLVSIGDHGLQEPLSSGLKVLSPADQQVQSCPVSSQQHSGLDDWGWVYCHNPKHHTHCCQCLTIHANYNYYSFNRQHSELVWNWQNTCHVVNVIVMLCFVIQVAVKIDGKHKNIKYINIVSMSCKQTCTGPLQAHLGLA